MRFLIDTQILIWSIGNTKKISDTVKDILVQNDIFVSQLSFFEIAIKQSINKLSELSLPVNEIRIQAQKDGINVLEIAGKHIDIYSSIPLIQDHRTHWTGYL